MGDQGKLKVQFIGLGLAASTWQCVNRMLETVGVEVAQGQADLLIARWRGPRYPFGSMEHCPVVRWWVGSDAVAQEAIGWQGTNSRVEARFNWAGSAEVQARLAALGIESEVLAILPLWQPEILPWPLDKAEKRVLIYAPPRGDWLYQWETTLKVVAALPDVEFWALRREKTPEFPNLFACGTREHEDMRTCYQVSKAVLRLTEWDGMSLMALEAAGFGRWVAWNHDFPPGLAAGTVEEAVESLKEAMMAGPDRFGVRWSSHFREKTLIRMGELIQEALR